MPIQPGAARNFNGSASTYVTLHTSSVPNRRLFIQPNKRLRISLDSGVTYGVVGALDSGRAHDLGVTDPLNLSILSDETSSGTVYWWTLDAGES